jgi:hypothetical protein
MPFIALISNFGCDFIIGLFGAHEQSVQPAPTNHEIPYYMHPISTISNRGGAITANEDCTEMPITVHQLSGIPIDHVRLGLLRARPRSSQLHAKCWLKFIFKPQKTIIIYNYLNTS